MSTTYRIPIKQHQSEIQVQNSKFITIIDKALTVQHARDFISNMKVAFPSANHHVYAFCIGYGNSIIEGMSDDREPTGTAGPPTLAVLRGSDLGDIVIVTVRYFGGKKLGTGGLVRAYTESAQMALKHLQTELNIPKQMLGVTTPYHLYEIVKLLIVEYDGQIQDETFTSDVTIVAQFAESAIAEFTQILSEKTSGQIVPVILTETID